MRVILLILLIFSASLKSTRVGVEEADKEQSDPASFSNTDGDLQMIVSRLQDKISDALGIPRFRVLSWNQVEVVSGWPSSVYLLEPSRWGIHDVEALKEAVDSVTIRKAEESKNDTLTAGELQAQLMKECERLNLIRTKRKFIDWQRLAANTEGLLLTTTHYSKWNTQDRRMIQRLISHLEQIEDASVFLECKPLNKCACVKLKKHLEQRLKLKGDADEPLQKKMRIESPSWPVITEEEVKEQKEEIESIFQSESEASSIKGEDHEQPSTVILDTMPEGFTHNLSSETTGQTILLPSLHRSQLELELCQSLDILNDVLEDSRLEAIILDGH